jgi:hypothetical protein
MSIATNNINNTDNTDNTDNTYFFNIYIMKKDGTLLEQASVTETKTDTKPYSNFIINVNKLPLHIAHMVDYSKELFELMMKYEVDYPYNSDKYYQTKMYNFVYNDDQNEFVRGIIFHRVIMRKGSYFYVIQQSDRGIRFLLYSINRINHSSNAFGSSMIMPKPTEQLIEMRDKLQQFTIKQLNDLQLNNLQLNNLQLNNLQLNNFSELIMKNELFFL